MGALTMTSKLNNDIEKALNEHEVVRDCFACSQGLMIPSTKTFYKTYKDMTLTIENVPVFKCENDECNEVVYGTGSLMKAIRHAKEHFDTSGETTYKYNK